MTDLDESLIADIRYMASMIEMKEGQKPYLVISPNLATALVKRLGSDWKKRIFDETEVEIVLTHKDGVG